MMENNNYKKSVHLEKERKVNKGLYCCFYCLMLTFFWLEIIYAISELGSKADFSTIFMLIIEVLLAGFMVFGFVYLINRNNLAKSWIINCSTLCVYSLSLIVFNLCTLGDKSYISAKHDYSLEYLFIVLLFIVLVGLKVSMFFKDNRKNEVISNRIAFGVTFLLLVLILIMIFISSVYIPAIVLSAALTLLLPSYFVDIKMQFHKEEKSDSNEDERMQWNNGYFSEDGGRVDLLYN